MTASNELTLEFAAITLGNPAERRAGNRFCVVPDVPGSREFVFGLFECSG
jgi:hypothetical protein